MDQYLPILLLLVLGVAFAAGSFLASRLLGPTRPSAVKDGPYESGIVPGAAPPTRFPVRFYLVAMIFVIFDIEVVFLYPWATIYVSLSTFGLAEMATFALVVFVSFAYLVSNGALDWGPPKHLRPASLDRSRSSMANVKRVPRPDQVVSSTALLPVEPEPVPEQATPGMS
ncbi:MAG: NADH-quinone oxidoreductase subunit A [Acidimicrobiales bacterium]